MSLRRSARPPPRPHRGDRRRHVLGQERGVGAAAAPRADRPAEDPGVQAGRRRPRPAGRPGDPRQPGGGGGERRRHRGAAPAAATPTSRWWGSTRRSSSTSGWSTWSPSWPIAGPGDRRRPRPGLPAPAVRTDARDPRPGRVRRQDARRLCALRRRRPLQPADRRWSRADPGRRHRRLRSPLPRLLRALRAFRGSLDSIGMGRLFSSTRTKTSSASVTATEPPPRTRRSASTETPTVIEVRPRRRIRV